MRLTVISAFLCIVLWATGSRAQNWNADYYQDDTDSSITIRNIHFFRNLEYFGLYDGMSVDAGVSLLKFWGDPLPMKVEPYLRLSYQYSERFQLVLGRIREYMHYDFVAPLYSPERNLTHPNEYGLQIITHTARWQTETWINWEKFIVHNSPFQEEFALGHSQKWFFDIPATQAFSLELQNIITHKGGQIDNDPNPVQSIANAAIGVNVLWRPLGEMQLHSRAFLLAYADVSPLKKLPYIYGRGYLAQQSFAFRNLELGLQYWYGDFFITTRGDYLYQSMSTFQQDYTEPQRSLLKTSIAHHTIIHQVLWIRSYLDVIFDTYNERQDIAFGVEAYLKLNEKWFMRKIKEIPDSK